MQTSQEHFTAILDAEFKGANRANYGEFENVKYTPICQSEAGGTCTRRSLVFRKLFLVRNILVPNRRLWGQERTARTW